MGNIVFFQIVAAQQLGDSIPGPSPVVLDPREPLLFKGHGQRPVDEQTRRRLGRVSSDP